MSPEEWNERSAAAARDLGLPDPEIECNARLNLADNLVALGRLAEAEEHFAFVGRIVEAPLPAERFMLWRYSQHYLHSYGELSLLRGDVETRRHARRTSAFGWLKTRTRARTS